MLLMLGGARVLVGWAQREACGVEAGTAFLLSVQALGAAPSTGECLGFALPPGAPGAGE